MQTLYLKKGEERRILAGHLWVFSNEVDTRRSSLKQFEPGEQARVCAASGRPLGAAMVNPNALICGRMYDRDPSRRLDADLLRERLERALQLRDALYEKPFYRLAYSEGDYMPGLIVDRFDSTLVVQVLTAGMEAVLETVLQSLHETVRPDCIVLHNDTKGRELEGLEPYRETVHGASPDEVEVPEGPNRFAVSLAEGQKTGWFFDQRPNRELFGCTAGALGARTALDVYSYAGGFGLAAAAHGARTVCVDSSERALVAAEKSALASGVTVETVHGDALKVMEEMVAEGRLFDAVSLDPPAFVKRAKELKRGLAGYAKANRLALSLVQDGGVLLSSSCSQHVQAKDLRTTLAREAAKSGVRLQVLQQTHQGPDHPAHPSMPETDYLKGFLVRVMR